MRPPCVPPVRNVSRQIACRCGLLLFVVCALRHRWQRFAHLCSASSIQWLQPVLNRRRLAVGKAGNRETAPMTVAGLATPDRRRLVLAVAALVLGAVGMGASPVFVRFADVGPYASAFWRVFLALPFLWL